jgi:pimeloyl-ACP methyl ester carboxylesterase/DNA-binding SARP family transcriptional activator
MGTVPAISIELLGRTSVRAGDLALPLPASRKTRALLGYLVLTETQQRRDRLCELLWEVPDDPRGALRWSLSKLRPIINFDGRERLGTEQGKVFMVLDDVDVDVHRINRCLKEDGTPKALSTAWQAASELLLIDCELADQPNFNAWLALERQKVANMRVALAKRLTFCDQVDPDEAIVWADRWLDDRPLDAEAAQAAVACRHRTGRLEEAVQRAAELEAVFRKSGLEIPSFATREPEQAPPSQAKSFVPAGSEQRPRQTIRFARTVDDVCLAWASLGAGGAPPLVKAACWLTHLELEREAPIWSPIYRELAVERRFIRYDGRGCGLSDWDVPNIDFNGLVIDLETVVDAAGVERFPLLGISQGVAVAIEYAARHPERVSHLILFGGSPAGWRFMANPGEIRKRDALTVLAEVEWGQVSASSRFVFSATQVPNATQDELAWFDEFRRKSTSPRNAARFLQVFLDLDVRHRLADLKVPTLVLHSRDDPRVPVWAGRALATAISGAQFVGLESGNHMLIGREPASNAFVAAVRRFLAAAR